MTAAQVIQPSDPPRGARLTADLVDVDLTDPTTFVESVPHHAFDVLRNANGIAWHAEKRLTSTKDHGHLIQFADSPGHWAVTAHHLVDEVLRDQSRFSSELGSTLMETVTADSLPLLRGSMINMDAPQHTRLRRILAPVFTPRSVQRLQDSIQANAREIMAEILQRDECDLVTDVSAEMPLRVLADLFGMPRSDRHLLFEWSEAAVAGEKATDADTVAASMNAYAAALSYAQDLAEQRRTNPQQDIMTMIVDAQIDGDQLSEFEFAMFWMLLIVAGNETTRNAVSGSVLSLIETGQWSWLATHPDAIGGAVEELLRFVTPIMHFRRTATTDTLLGDQNVRAGDKVVVWFSAANRDPDVFRDPHSLQLRRAPNPHLGFGIGPHFCLGAHLARMEITHMMTELLRHAPQLELAGNPTRTASNFINGISRLPVRLGAPQQ